MATQPERLDQILIRLGFATAAQIELALHKQQGLGGRLGTHLVYAGHVTEDQLARALSVQFGVPAFDATRQRPSRDLLGRLPAGFARQHQVLPLGLDEQTGTLTLAAVDPRDTTALGETRRLLRCRAVSLCVVPEVTFERVLAAAGTDDDGLFGTRRLIELPELFEEARAAEAAADLLTPAAAPTAGAGAGPSAPRLLLVTERAFLRSFLAPLLEREGRAVTTAGDAGEAAAALAAGDIAHVLVSAELEDGWRDWLRRGLVAAPQATVTRLGPVGDVLLETAAPYAAMQQSLLRALRLHAESAGDPQAVPPPYDLLRRDARGLGAAAGLDRLALDALEAAVLLLTPAAPPAADVTALLADDGTGIDWSRTLADAAALAFPWPLEPALAAMRQLLSERVNLDEFGRHDPELALAAQVLALVWHHHQRATGPVAGDGRRVLASRAALRARGGQLARAELVERYVALLERSEDDLVAAGHQLLLVGPADRASRQLAARLGHLGYRVHALADGDEAAALCERQPPAAVLVYDTGGTRDLTAFAARLRGGARLLVCAVTTLADPAHVLNLFDAGFDDVFALPRDLELIPARLRKALRAADQAPPPPAARPGCFQAAFTAFAFTDLMQTLSQSLKTVRIDLTRGDGETAVVYLDRGQLTHAACGRLQGGEAVYRIIAWEDDGHFAVEPVTEFPEPNIGLPLESILMEGCRLLDESRI